MKNFCKDLREHSTKVINCEKLEMMPLPKKVKKSHSKQDFRYICKKIFVIMMTKKFAKFEIIVITKVKIEGLCILSLT